MKYFAIINGQRLGPFDISQLQGVGVTKDTMVWHEGMAQWQPAGTMPELEHLFVVNGTNANSCNVGGNYYNSGYGYSHVPPMPKTWLVESILVTILCCMPFGIVGIVYAAGVSDAYHIGNYALAQERSVKAKWWTLAGLIVPVVVGVIYFILVLLAVSFVPTLPYVYNI